MIKSISSILLLILSTSYAFSQSGEVDILSLISVCNNQQDSVTSTHSILGALEFVEGTVADDTLKKTLQKKPTPSFKKESGIATLTAIADAYDSDNYYMSGAWVRDEQIVYPESVAPPVSGVPFVASKPLRITSHYGFRQEFNRMHYGIDLAMCEGDTVKVPMPGKICQIGCDVGGYGKYMIVLHDNGLETRYAHLKQPLVKEGENVTLGMPIALSGNTGHSTGPHLHLETRYKGIPLNPLLVFNF